MKSNQKIIFLRFKSGIVEKGKKTIGIIAYLETFGKLKYLGFLISQKVQMI